MTQEVGKKIKNFDGLGLKIAVLYFIALSPTSLNNFKRYRRRRQQILIAVADGGKILYRRRRKRLKNKF